MRTSATVIVAAFLSVQGCRSTGGSAAADAGVSDATSRGDAPRPRDARAIREATAVLRDATHPTDAASPHRDANADGGASPYGDRNLGVHEPYPSSVLIQNGGRFYDVTNPPTSAQHAAAGDGTTDDTAAILDAFDYLKAAYVAANPTGSATSGYDGSNNWVYFPNGTYRVTSTLSYRGATLATSTFDDLVRIRIVGESREGVTLKLDDDLPTFGNPASPAVVLEFQHDGTTFNNAPATNVLTNLTIDTGRGNPGAVGLWFQGANLTSMHNVKVVSEDGAGICGIWFRTGSVQGYYRDLTVLGFDYGICQTDNPEFDTALEHVTLEGQRAAGVLAEGGGMSLRAFAIDESTTSAPGLVLEKTGAVVFLDDSSLVGARDAGAIVRTATAEEALFVRDVTTSYGRPLIDGDAGVDAAAVIDWFATSPPVKLFDAGPPAASLGLPVEDTPLAEWYDPASDWADVDAFGAAGDGTTDDSAAIQRAMSSGKPVVVFPKTTYLWKTTVTVPATVERVDFMYSDVQGSLSVNEASSTPLRLSYHPGYGSVALAASRPVVLADWSGGFANPKALATKVYLENVANIGSDPSFAPAGQTTWARSLNDEQASGPGDVVVDGGTLWLFGYKTENKPVTSIVAANGARVEVQNGYVNMTLAQGSTPMIVDDGAELSYLGFTNLGSAIQGPFQVVLSETHDGGARTLSYDAGFGGELPRRGGVYGGDFVVPLFVGGVH